MYNPGGPSLPPDQEALASAYRQALSKESGICFNQLFTITNVPIGRFLRDLERAGDAEAYHALLHNAFSPDTIDGLMCRHQLHVGWDGKMYDCDFNFALGLPALGARHVAEFDAETFRGRQVVTGKHCFACTAGCGSSCGGAIT